MAKQLAVRGRDVTLNYVATGFRLCNSFILLPFLLHYLTDDGLGLWYIFLAIYGFVVLFQAGFAPTFARNVVYCWSGATSLEKVGLSESSNGEVNYRLLKAVVSSCRIIYTAISIVALVVLLTVGTVYIQSVSSGVDFSNVQISWLIFCLGIFLNLLFSYCESVIRGIGDIFGVSVAIIISSIVQLSVAVVMLVCNFGLLGASFGFLAQGVVFRFICMYRFNNFEQLGKRLKLISVKTSEIRSALKAVTHNAVKDTFVSVASYLSTTANTLICSSFFSLAITGNYSVTMQIINAVAVFAGAVSVAYQPSLQSAFSNKNFELACRLCGTVLTLYHAVYILVLIAAMIIIVPIVGIIKPLFTFDATLVAMLAVYYYLWKHHSICASLISNSNSIPYMKAFVFASFLGVALSILFIAVFKFGIMGLVLGQVIAQIIYNNWKWPSALVDMLKTNYFDLLKLGVQNIKAKITGNSGI